MLTLNNSLHFVSRHFKQFSVPRVIIAESDIGAGGYYEWNINTIQIIDNEEVYIDSNGAIVISYDSTFNIESTLLHEYRHHLQHCMHGKWYVPNWQAGESIDEYYRSCWEVDARLFEASLSELDEFTDKFKTIKSSRATMLNLPSERYLRGIIS